MPLLPPLQDRDRQPEIMDRPDLDPAAHHRALRGLARINRWSRSVVAIWPVVEDAARQTHGRPVRVFDLACGAGDVLVGLWRRAAKAGVPVALDGSDISSVALEHAARRAAEAGAVVRLFQADALRDTLPDGYDVVCTSLFLHHLADDEAVAVLTRMKQCTERVVAVDDLLRSPAGYALAWAGTRLLTRSRVVHADGPLSVRAAFTVPEVRQLADRAGLTGATVRRHWPYRFLLTWSRG
ncbi:MAG TPA: methyltransferase domain-containing protein [Fimbriiglobus sp.]|nr:methyltransferase domain-containing protein [Fimbriiglobus sp.]